MARGKKKKTEEAKVDAPASEESNEMTDNADEKESGPETIKIEGSYFDLDAFEEKSESTEIEFLPAADLADAMERVGNDADRVVELINSALRAQAVNAAKREISAKGVGKQLVYKVARGFYELPQFAGMSLAEKRKAVFGMLREAPALLQSLREAAAASDDDENEENDDNE